MSKNEFDALLLKKLQEEAFEYSPKSWEQLSERLDMPAFKADEMLPLDTLLSQKLQEGSFEYNHQNWQQLSQILNGQQKEKEPTVVPFGRKWGIAIGTAAAICLFITLAIILNNNPKTTIHEGASIVHQSSTPPNTKATGNPATTTPVSDESITASKASSGHQNKTDQHLTNSVLPPSNNQPSNNVNPILQNRDNEQNIPVSKEVVVLPKDQKESMDRFNKEMMAPGKKEQLSDAETALRNASQNWPQDYLKTNETSKKAKTNLALGGGVNYGNLNTGYTGAVTVKRKISGDFFVDGTVAMLYNNNANNVAVNNGPSVNSPNNLASKPTSASISSPALAPIQRLYYVQFNPSFGYQVEDRIAVSLGGDVQQMLGTKDEVVQPQDDNTKVFPTVDVGLTTKTEFTITPNLQAGLVYREGLNNLIKGSDAGTYVNRRYLQVQFKYNIPMGK